MSGRSFKSVFMVASCAGAALGCYMVSLRVASERSKLESVETQIVMAQRDIRLLQTEIGTRGRLSQLERWNAGAFALSAPNANQFLGGSFELAKLVEPQKQVDFQAPVVLASAPAPEPKAAPIGQPETNDAGIAEVATTRTELLHQASLKTGTREAPATTTAAIPLRAVAKSTDKPVAAAISAPKKSADKPGLAAAKPVQKPTTEKPVAVAKKAAEKPAATAAKVPPKKTVDKPSVAAAKPMTKPVRIAKADVLAPAPGKPVKKTKDHVSGQ